MIIDDHENPRSRYHQLVPLDANQEPALKMAGAPGAGSGPWSHGVVLPFCEAVSDLAEAGGCPRDP